MDMRFSTGAIVCLFLSVKLFAQTGDYGTGARAMAVGFTAGTFSDEWAGFNNIGAVAGGSRDPAVAFSCQSLYGIKGLVKKAAAINLPYKTFAGTVNFFRFGDEYFSESRIGLGFGHKIRFVSLGASINYLQWSMEYCGSRGIFYVDAGGLAELFPGFWVGAWMQNINQARISEISRTKFPVTLDLSLSYRPEDFLLVNMEIVKTDASGTRVKAGAEYGIHNKLFLRTGIMLNPVRNFFGFGLKPRRFIIDYAFSFQNYLGCCHALSLGILLNRKHD